MGYPPPGYPPPGYPPPPGYGYPPLYSPPVRFDAMAIAAMVLGILGIPGAVFGIFSLLALIFGLTVLPRTRRGEARGFGFAVSGVIMGGFGLIIGVAIWVGATSYFSSGETVATEELRPTECVVGPVDAETAKVVSCEVPHRFEVLASLNDRSETGPGYPGREELRARAIERCAPMVLGYLGVEIEPFPLTIRALVPTGQDWDRGDRWFACLLERTDSKDLDIPLRGYGLRPENR